MNMFIGGTWVDKKEKIEVIHPYDGRVIDTVPKADKDDVEKALTTAARVGAPAMRTLTAYERSRCLEKLARFIRDQKEQFADTISMESGKPLDEAQVEVQRAQDIIQLCAEESKRMYGDVIPLDASLNGQDTLGFTMRVPCGVVVALCPFNFPLHLVAHKLGPALAAGNAVIVKPSSDTPLSALKLTALAARSGFPEGAIQCITGEGKAIGSALCRDHRVRKVSFTGSRSVGETLSRVAGVKKVTMELGSNAPVIVMDDADVTKACRLIVETGYSNAGQTCISPQRVFIADSVYEECLQTITDAASSLRTGDPFGDGVQVGPLIRERDVERIMERIQEAVNAGGRVTTGGHRDGTCVAPTVLADVPENTSVMREEIFGPVLVINRFSTLEEAITKANDTQYGLSAGIFTSDIFTAMEFIQRMDAGNVHVNWAPQWRADLMPYGGLKQSGYGKEGPRYAIEEMSDTKMVVFHT